MTSRMRRLSLVCLAFFVAACDTTAPTPAETTAVFVGNQGIFADNSGSVTRHDPASGATTADAVPDLGGLVQNVVVHNDRLYVLLNFDDSFSTRRGRIDVIDLATGARTQQIDVEAPRSMAVVGGTAYVSNLYSASVTPVFLATGQTGTPVAVGENPEGVAAVGQRVYVANFGFGFYDYLSIVDAPSGTATRTPRLCDGPRALAVDAEDDLWVVCTGRFDFTTGTVAAPGEVLVLDGQSADVLARFPAPGLLGTNALGTDAALSRSRDELFVAAPGGLLRFDTAANAAAGRIDVPGAEISAVAFDDATGRLVLGRMDAANPYAADGAVTFHDAGTGAETGRFAAGVIPGAVAFRQTDAARAAMRVNGR